MDLVDMIRKNKAVQTANIKITNHANQTELNAASIAIAKPTDDKNNIDDLDKIRAWLFKIDEPEEDHYLVLDKCRNDPEAMEYFLKHARGEYEAKNP